MKVHEKWEKQDDNLYKSSHLDNNMYNNMHRVNRHIND